MKVRIGLEIHVQLNRLRSKLFCGCPANYHGAPPNTHVCPVCLGLPGALPRINRKAVEYALRVAVALDCKVADQTLFYRKNYFYPDLPRGFQISQYDYPLATGGKLSIDVDGNEKEIRIRRVHLEEDPGKLSYHGTIDTSPYTLIDYNRSGMPLLEIVTEPDLESPKEARIFLAKLRNVLEYLDVFDGSKEGSMRVDANISIEGGGRVEIKNISSYKGVERALLFEISRQMNMIRRGERISRETRHFDEKRLITISLRSKETEEDYRYFPEPDLVPMRVKEWINQIKIPELPDAKKERFVRQYGISEYHAKVLTSDIRMANFFEEVAKYVDPRLSASWIADVLKGELNYRDDHFVILKKIGENPDLIGFKKVEICPDVGMKFRPDGIAEDGERTDVEVEVGVVDADEAERIRRRFEMLQSIGVKKLLLLAPMVTDDGRKILDGVGAEIREIDVDEMVGNVRYTIDMIKPSHMVEILQMLQQGKITESGAVEIIRTLLDEGGEPAEIVRRKGLMKIGVDEIGDVVDRVLHECSQAVEDYRRGKREALDFIVGRVMKACRGRADPRAVREALLRKLEQSE